MNWLDYSNHSFCMVTMGRNFCSAFHFLLTIFSSSSDKHCAFTLSSTNWMCMHTSSVHVLPTKLFPWLSASEVWVCILEALAMGSWFESLSQGEIVFRLCLLFPICGHYAHSRCQPSCCALVWCLHCVAANHTALSPLLYPAVISRAGNPAKLQFQQRGSLDRVKSDKIPLRWIFSATEDRQSGGYE